MNILGAAKRDFIIYGLGEGCIAMIDMQYCSSCWVQKTLGHSPGIT